MTLPQQSEPLTVLCKYEGCTEVLVYRGGRRGRVCPKHKAHIHALQQKAYIQRTPRLAAKRRKYNIKYLREYRRDYGTTGQG